MLSTSFVKKTSIFRFGTDFQLNETKLHYSVVESLLLVSPEALVMISNEAKMPRLISLFKPQYSWSSTKCSIGL